MVVDPLFVGAEFRTCVWISERASNLLTKYVRKRSGLPFLRKLKYYAERGFESLEHGDGPIRYEANGVYRIGHSSSLFRLIGFYGDVKKEEFVIIDAFTKGGQKLSAPQRRRIAEVARIRQRTLRWRKRS